MHSAERITVDRSARRAAGGWGLAALLWSPAAFAQPLRQERPCVDDKLTVAGAFDDAWVRAIDAACAKMKALRDRDGLATVELSRSDAGAELTVRLADGRTAQRSVSRPEDLAVTIEALLTLPPKAPAEPQPPRPSAQPKGEARVEEKAPKASGIPLGFDVAALATGRILGEHATLGVGVVASAGLDIDDGWLVGLRLRADPALFAVGHDTDLTGGSFGGGVELGRRVRVGSALALDFGLGADGLADIPYGDDDRADGETEGDLRTRAFSKVWVSGEGLSFTGLLGFELSPPRLAADHRRGDEERPAYGAELGVGFGWSGL